MLEYYPDYLAEVDRPIEGMVLEDCSLFPYNERREFLVIIILIRVYFLFYNTSYFQKMVNKSSIL